MKHFRAEAVIIKRVNNVEIIFWNKEEIYVRNTDTNQWTLFHRYFAPKGSYTGGWSQFRHLLLYEWAHLDYNHAYRLAFRWGILSQNVGKGPDITKVRIIERFSK